MIETILFVDDDVRIVNTFQQALRRHYQVEVAGGAQEALGLVLDGRFAVVVSDLNMPGMDGIEFLRRVKSVAPHTIGILLTAWADLEAAIDAVNNGHIFRFLRKPCPQDQLRSALDAALTQYRLTCAERDLLGDTLIGALGMLMELLGKTRPEAFGRTTRIRQLMRHMATELSVGRVWELEAAGLLSQIGCISVPPEVLKRYFAGAVLTPDETLQVLGHAEVGSQLVRRVSRLNIVAQMIQHQKDSFKETAGLCAEALTMRMGAQMLRVATEFERLLGMGVGVSEAIRQMRNDAGEYNPHVLEAIERLIGCDALAHVFQEPVSSTIQNYCELGN